MCACLWRLSKDLNTDTDCIQTVLKKKKFNILTPHFFFLKNLHILLFGCLSCILVFNESIQMTEI